ncbi:hypothetical protein WJX73_010227 [Symbiochloris irregularis]|uniref:Uncharacterized protein n=1 Tax=Symbiochloris irregularis TaxID=706552 RepID=A0AAW1NVD5_9CHLO
MRIRIPLPRKCCVCNSPARPDAWRHNSIALCAQDPARTGDDSADSLAEPDQLTQLSKYAKWIVSLMLVIGAFYGAVFYASGSLSMLIKDRYPKREFMPYSEKRRLEENASSAEPAGGFPSSDELLNLLPGKR